MRLRTTAPRAVAVLTVAIVSLLLTATVVVANHNFSDVPTGAFYHDSVEFLVDHNITSGCGGGKYCPGNPVSRGEMAVFLERIHGIAPQVITVTNPSFQTFNTTTFTNLSGAVAGITVPTGNTGRIVARVSGESICSDPSWCSLRILIDGVEADPASGADFAFDSDGDEPWEAHSMERTDSVGPGLHVVTVQGAVEDGGGAFTLDDWILVVELFIT